MSYAPGTIIPEKRSEAKVNKVKVTKNGARHPAISNACTNQIWIPTSNNVGDMLGHTRAHAHTHTHTHTGQGHSDKNGARHPQSQDACTNQIWIPTSNNIGDMFRTRILYK